MKALKTVCSVYQIYSKAYFTRRKINRVIFIDDTHKKNCVLLSSVQELLKHRLRCF